MGKFYQCQMCNSSFGEDNFVTTKNPFYKSGKLPICNGCLVEMLQKKIEEDSRKTNGAVLNWNAVDKLCQLIDIPFIPSRWRQLYETQKARAIIPYARIFLQQEYEGFDWKDQQTLYEELKANGELDNIVIPELQQKERIRLKEKWGMNYDDEELNYLETLLTGIQGSQSVNGALQLDQALKLCKISSKIDSCLRAGDDIDKLLQSYEKIVKVAEFTPKNIKNAQDFESVGELFSYLEKTGFINKFYDGVKRDEVDITMADIQENNQRLYTNEQGIGESIDKRIEGLKRAQELEDQMGMMEGYNTTLSDDDNDDYLTEEFDPET